VVCGEGNRRVNKIVIEFTRRTFVVLVRYLGEIIIRNKILSEILIALRGFRLEELYYNLPESFR